jgi:F0F1-type ATP synthase assembly protein I
MMPDIRSQRSDASGNYARFIGLGITLLLIFALPTLVGYFVDKVVGTLPLFLLVGLAAGFVGGMYYVYRALQKLGG